LVGELYSVALTNNYQQADTDTKMIHIKSTIISKGISPGKGRTSIAAAVHFPRVAIFFSQSSNIEQKHLPRGQHTFNPKRRDVA
jgi:Fe-S cluster assembly protein SufB